MAGWPIGAAAARAFCGAAPDGSLILATLASDELDAADALLDFVGAHWLQVARAGYRVVPVTVCENDGW